MSSEPCGVPVISPVSSSVGVGEGVIVGVSVGVGVGVWVGADVGAGVGSCVSSGANEGSGVATGASVGEITPTTSVSPGSCWFLFLESLLSIMINTIRMQVSIHGVMIATTRFFLIPVPPFKL
jgi:hypothetical protein